MVLLGPAMECGVEWLAGTAADLGLCCPPTPTPAQYIGRERAHSLRNSEEGGRFRALTARQSFSTAKESPEVKAA